MKNLHDRKVGDRRKDQAQVWVAIDWIHMNSIDNIVLIT